MGLCSSVATSCFSRMRKDSTAVCASRDWNTTSRAVVNTWLASYKEERCYTLDVDVAISMSFLFSRESILLCNVAIDFFRSSISLLHKHDYSSGEDVS